MQANTFVNDPLKTIDLNDLTDEVLISRTQSGDNKRPKAPWTEAVIIGVVFAVLWIISKLLGG